MIKLQGHTLTPVDLFSPESMALTITERSSTAQITQGLDAPSLQAGDWLLAANQDSDRIAALRRELPTPWSISSKLCGILPCSGK